jgi:hypothetical protein
MIPAVPGPPVAVTNAPWLSPVAGRMAKVTSIVRSSELLKWSRGISMVTQVKSESGHGAPSRASMMSVVERSTGGSTSAWLVQAATTRHRAVAIDLITIEERRPPL